MGTGRGRVPRPMLPKRMEAAGGGHIHRPYRPVPARTGYPVGPLYGEEPATFPATHPSGCRRIPEDVPVFFDTPLYHPDGLLSRPRLMAPESLSCRGDNQ
jgi:hypothetical protein